MVDAEGEEKRLRSATMKHRFMMEISPFQWRRGLKDGIRYRRCGRSVFRSDGGAGFAMYSEAFVKAGVTMGAPETNED
jgi:hypothetical protein